MNDSRDIDELDLLALADGLLDADPGRKAAVEAAAAHSPDASARLRDYRAQNAALRSAYRRVVAEPVPVRLHAALDTGASPERLWRRAAAAAVVAVAAGTGGWLVGQHDPDARRQTLIDESYRQFVTHGDGGVAATPAAGPISSAGWLDDDMSIRLKAPDLSAEGYELVEKRALREDRIVALDYAAMDGRSFTLFVAPRWEERPAAISEVERGEVTLAYWHEGPIASSIATRLPRGEARGLAETVRRAMRDNAMEPPAALEPEFRPGGTGQETVADAWGDQIETETPAPPLEVRTGGVDAE